MYRESCRVDAYPQTAGKRTHRAQSKILELIHVGAAHPVATVRIALPKFHSKFVDLKYVTVIFKVPNGAHSEVFQSSVIRENVIKIYYVLQGKIATKE